jgi:hypothetical protein
MKNVGIHHYGEMESEGEMEQAQATLATTANPYIIFAKMHGGLRIGAYPLAPRPRCSSGIHMYIANVTIWLQPDQHSGPHYDYAPIPDLF